MSVTTFTEKFNTISDCLNHFDFEKVHQVMMYLDWKWYMVERGYKIPCVDDLKATATRLVSDAYDAVASGHDNYIVGTGGFEAFAYRIKDTGEIVVELKFVLETS